MASEPAPQRHTVAPSSGRRPGVPEDGRSAPHLISVLGVRHRVSVTGTPEDRIAAIASLQRGRIARRQLLEAGISYAAIRRRVHRGYLHQVHHCVFAVGHMAPMPLAAETAALLAVAPPAVLGYGSAAALWGAMVAPEAVQVLVATDSAPALAGVTVHRTRSLDPTDVRIRQGLPVTSPARTLLDQADNSSERQIEHLFNELVVQGHLRLADVVALLGRANGRRGVGVLRALLDDQSAPKITRSEAEAFVLRLLRRAQLPDPQTNAPLLGFEVDFLWPEHRFVLEFDSFQFHSVRRALERDRRKDGILIAAGYVPMRITWREVQNEPYAFIARVAGALGRAAV